MGGKEEGGGYFRLTYLFFVSILIFLKSVCVCVGGGGGGGRGGGGGGGGGTARTYYGGKCGSKELLIKDRETKGEINSKKF